MRRRWWVGRAAGVLLTVMFATGCQAPADELGGLPVQTRAEMIPGHRSEVSGTVQENAAGCLVLETPDAEPRWVVWPPGSVAVAEGVRLSDGSTVDVGMAVSGTGTLLGAESLPAWRNPDSFYGSHGRYCSAVDVVVFDHVTTTEPEKG